MITYIIVGIVLVILGVSYFKLGRVEKQIDDLDLDLDDPVIDYYEERDKFYNNYK